MDGGSPRRSARNRSVPSRGHSGACSCEYLSELSNGADLQPFFAELGLSPEAIARGRAEFHANAPSEPADWNHRLQARGARAGPQAAHQALLAMVRSADLHAYRLLQHLGAPPARVRKLLVARISTLAQSHAGKSAALPPSGRAPIAPGPQRMSSRRNSAPSPERQSARASAQSPGSGRSQSQSQGQVEHSHDHERRARPRSLPGPAASLARPQAERELAASLPTASTPEAALHPIDPGDLPPLLGRERELEMLADALGRSRLRPTLLVGEAGGGSSVLAAHLAGVLDRPVYRLSASEYADEESLRIDLDEVAAAQGVAIIDDLERAGTDAPPPCLAAVTHAWTAGPSTLTLVTPEGRARLQSWLPGVLDTLDTLECLALAREHLVPAVRESAGPILESHGVTLAREARIEQLVRVADTFLTGLAMPGRALDLLDLAAGRAAREGHSELRSEHWIDVVTRRTGLPRNRVAGNGDQDVLDLDAALARYVVGHSDALGAISSLVRRNRAGFSSHRPIASVLLLGPSGVGKTEIAKALAASLFDRPDALLRLDMSEYAEAHAVARVVGAPPGYVGHEQGGALTDPLLAQPHRVVLLDEIEKAHRDVHQLLLQVFDEGRLTDGRGRTVDFRHALVIMTSNLGATLMEEDPDTDEDRVLDEARSAFPVELWNRIEAPLVLRPLTSAELHKVCKRLIRTSSQRLEHERGVRYSLDESASARLVSLAGQDPSLGARPLRHLVAREIESMIGDQILRGGLRAGDSVEVHFGARGFTLQRA